MSWTFGSSIDEQIATVRRALRLFIIAQVGEDCECCNRPAFEGDIHEVWVRRSAVPKDLQLGIFVRENCARVCLDCHRHDIGQLPPAESEAFKIRFAERLKQLGYENVPFVFGWGKRQP